MEAMVKRDRKMISGDASKSGRPVCSSMEYLPLDINLKGRTHMYNNFTNKIVLKLVSLFTSHSSYY